ncbi:MAG: hypothetical protein K6B44_03490 [Lachnospiraceae bacterium]|nr:hypothetical protein [Lachnospiraceae bacterium]
MKRFSNGQLKLIRNLICIAGIAGGFVLWIFLPETFRNTKLFHIGNGEYGSKNGVLILLLIQFLAFIPNADRQKIHADDQEERAMLEEERKREELVRQIYTALGLALTIWIVMGLGLLLL